MFARRAFLKATVATTGVATLCTGDSAEARNSTDSHSGVGGYNYRLPGFTKGSRLLFQGDSITDMKWGRNQNDRNHYLGHSYVYLIAARLGVDLPKAQLDIYNRGMSGHKVADLRGRWQKDAVEMEMYERGTEPLHLLFLDWSKAFDSITHESPSGDY